MPKLKVDDLHTHYHLMPSYTEEEREWKLKRLWEKDSKLKDIIEWLNSIIWWAHWAVTEIVWTEAEKMWIIHDLFENFIDKTWEIYSDIIEWKEWNIWYEKFVKVINLFFSAMKIKKFYNTIPKESFTDFTTTDLNDQIVKIILPLDTDDHFYSKVTWWSCHNWSILFHDYFEKLWIESDIIFLNPVSNHSFTKVKIWEKYYVMDPLYKMWKEPLFEIKIWSKLRVWSDEFWIVKNLDNFKFDVISDDEDSNIIKRNVAPKFFKEDLDFTNFLDNRDVNYIICGYNIAETRELFEIDFNLLKYNVLSFEFKKWDLKFNFELAKKKLFRLNNMNLDEMSNLEILIEVVKLAQKNKDFQENVDIEHLEVVAEKLNRNQFLKFLGLK